jgi:CubicO group peptidase (beta-lactamase class C family)
MKYWHALIGVGACLLAGCFEAPEPGIGGGDADSGSILSAGVIDAALMELVETGSVVGVSALVYEDDREAYFGAYGMADREAGQAMQRDTLVQIHSMTKPVTGVALMTLYEKGHFKLDDPITKYVPELENLRVYDGTDENGDPKLRPPSRMPTVLDVMRHTAGLASNDNTPVGKIYKQVNPIRWGSDLQEVVTKLGTIPLINDPGKEWRYSDVADIQALMVERFSGQPFDDYIRTTIFEPLGMNDTAYYVENDQRSRLAAMYETKGDLSLARVPDTEAFRYLSKKWQFTPGGFGLVSTIDDYMKFGLMLQGDGSLGDIRILLPETVKLMRTNSVDDAGKPRRWVRSLGQVGFGLDFAVRIAPPKKRKEHYGVVGEFFWDGLASTLFWVDPENDLTSVLFLQQTPKNNQAHHKFRNAVYNVDW